MIARTETIPALGRGVQVLDGPDFRVVCIPAPDPLAWPQAALLKGLSPEDFAARAAGLPDQVADGAAQTIGLNFNVFLIQKDGLNILVDAGVGDDKSRPGRPVWDRLKTPFPDILAHFGAAPDRIDILLLTHCHADHLGWAARKRDGAWHKTFANARHVAPAAELAALRDAAARAQDKGDVLHGAYADSFLPVEQDGGWEGLNPPCELAPGLRIESVPGHTAGMCALRLTPSGGGPDILFCSDAIHHPLQLKYPEIVSNFCADPETAVKTRLNMLSQASENGTILAAYHFPDPVFGTVQRDGKGYTFHPIRPDRETATAKN